MDTTKAPRRQLCFRGLQELLEDAEKQARQQTPTTGNWSQGQIFEHVARTMDRSIDGFAWRAPFHFRILGKLIKKKILRHGMTPGFQHRGIAAEHLVPTPTDTAAGLEHLRRAIGRLQTESKRAPHPFLGKLTPAEWEQVHLRHAELHMSFISG
jgi:Protein of unknown function (DUF1569)